MRRRGRGLEEQGGVNGGDEIWELVSSLLNSGSDLILLSLSLLNPLPAPKATLYTLSEALAHLLWPVPSPLRLLLRRIQSRSISFQVISTNMLEHVKLHVNGCFLSLSQIPCFNSRENKSGLICMCLYVHSF